MQNDRGKALEYATRAIELNPAYVKPFIRRSRIYKSQGDGVACLKDLAKVCAISRGSPDFDKYLMELFQQSSEIAAMNSARLFRVSIKFNILFFFPGPHRSRTISPDLANHCGRMDESISSA